jgi:hypothetical protein
MELPAEASRSCARVPRRWLRRQGADKTQQANAALTDKKEHEWMSLAR